MTKAQFIEITSVYYIDTGILLENENVREAIRENNPELLREVIETEF